MYRFSEDLDLKEIVGSEIHQICVGRYDVQFHFQSGTTIGGQAEVTLLKGTEEIARWMEDTGWSTLAYQGLLNLKVAAYSVPNDQLLRIEFNNGFVLQLHDSSDQYESFLITKPDGDMIVI